MNLYLAWNSSYSIFVDRVGKVVALLLFVMREELTLDLLIENAYENLEG